MAKSLETIPQMNPMFWKKLGDEIADKIRVHTTKNSKDVDGKPFKKYSDGYVKANLRRGKTNGTKVDLELSGDMMRNLQVRTATPYGVTIGWSGTNAEKVQWNADMGRTVTTDSKPLSDKVWKHAEKELSKQINKNLKAVAETTTITIG